MGSSEQFIIESIVRICHKLDAKGFGANHDGNVTVRFGDKIFATPTGISKGDATPEMIIVLDLAGNKISGHGKSFSEIQLHLAAYNARVDITAVVHAHPPYSTARGLAGRSLKNRNLPESVVSLGGEIPVAPFAMPGDRDNEKIVGDILRISNVFMMPGNGVLAVGSDDSQAYLRLELVEHLSKIDSIAMPMGNVFSLTSGQMNLLLDKRSKAGLAPPVDARIIEDGEVVKEDGTVSQLIEQEIARMVNEGRF